MSQQKLKECLQPFIQENMGYSRSADGLGLGRRHWSVYPALGWGLGLAVHAAIVLMAMPGASLYQRLLQRERARLQAQRDPW